MILTPYTSDKMFITIIHLGNWLMLLGLQIPLSLWILNKNNSAKRPSTIILSKISLNNVKHT